MAFTIENDAAGEKILKFDTFSCIFKAIFRFLFPIQGGYPPNPPTRPWYFIGSHWGLGPPPPKSNFTLPESFLKRKPFPEERGSETPGDVEGPFEEGITAKAPNNYMTGKKMGTKKGKMILLYNIWGTKLIRCLPLSMLMGLSNAY